MSGAGVGRGHGRGSGQHRTAILKVPRQGRPLERESVQGFNIFEAFFLALVGTSEARVGKAPIPGARGSWRGEEPAWAKKGEPR